MTAGVLSVSERCNSRACVMNIIASKYGSCHRDDRMTCRRGFESRKVEMDW